MEKIKVSDFGITKESDQIKKYTLTNKKGMKVEIINYGGIVISLTAPDRKGNYKDVVLGFVNSEDYFNENSYFFGAIIGRFGAIRTGVTTFGWTQKLSPHALSLRHEKQEKELQFRV